MTTRKTPARKTIVQEDTKNSPVSQVSNQYAFLRQRKNISVIFFLLILAILAFVYKSAFVVAFVNGRPITRLEIIKELERQGGAQTLDSLVSKVLIEQEAQKKGISVSQQDIEEQLKTQGQSLDQVLEAQGLSRKDLEEQTRLRIFLEKLLEDKVKVTDKEIEQALKEQKDALKESDDPEELRNQIKENLRNQKLSAEAQAYLQSLQEEAKIQYWMKY